MTHAYDGRTRYADDATIAHIARLEHLNRELERRLSEILDLVYGHEDIDSNGGPNLCMKIAMCARGEDRP